jgi:hypothetical protein
MIVGVADSVDELVGDHHSVERALSQVLMPRMSVPELEEIIERGCNELELSVEPDARRRIAYLSEGLPYYTHLLSLHAAQHAIMDDRDKIYPGDVDVGIREGVGKAQASIRSAWQTATRSPRPESLFEEVLLACALAPKDALGYFTASAVRDPMSVIMGRPYGIPACRLRGRVQLTSDGLPFYVKSVRDAFKARSTTPSSSRCTAIRRRTSAAATHRPSASRRSPIRSTARPTQRRSTRATSSGRTSPCG